MDYPTFALAGVSAAVLYGAAAYLKKNVLGREPYPPGPKGYPVIRNLFDVPSVDPWVGYVELGKACGMFENCSFGIGPEQVKGWVEVETWNSLTMGHDRH